MTSTACDDQLAPDASSREAALDAMVMEVQPHEWRQGGTMRYAGHTITWGEYVQRRHEMEEEFTVEPALDRDEMLQLLALRLRKWPQDCDDCERTEPAGWGWQWHDVPPDCEFVLAVLGREGREWCITESDWHKARWGAGEERIDRIAQSDASGDHYPPTCADGLPCGVAHSPGDDAYCLHCPHEPLDAEGQEEFDASMRVFTEEPFPKQARYQDARGEDWIDEFARTATPEEFRGAMRFTIGKYCRRAGKKDALVSEITKIEDYARRWREYELAREGDE